MLSCMYKPKLHLQSCMAEGALTKINYPRLMRPDFSMALVQPLVSPLCSCACTVHSCIL